MTENGVHAGELRRSRRLDIGKLVAGELVPSGAPIKIHDIGFGGFAIETSFPLEVGSVLGFRFTSTDGSSFFLRAGVIHSHEVFSPLGSVVHVSGLEFADKQQTSTDQRAEVLIDKVNWILSFYDEASRDSSEGAEPAEPDVRPSTNRGRSRPRAGRAP
jgi:hypothetical protein